MKKTTAGLVLSSIMTASVLVAGCGNGNSSAQGSSAAASQSAQPTASSASSASSVAPASDKASELTLWLSWEASDTDKKVFEAFKEKTGTSVNVVSVPYDQYRPKLVASLVSGQGPDVYNDGLDDFPAYAVKKMAAPIEDLMTLPTTDFLKAAVDTFTIDNHLYALTGTGSIRIIYYNKSMFQKLSLPDPRELYAQGKWDWNAFLNAAKAITKDTDGDGKTDQWGFTEWAGPESFIWSNGGDFLTKDNKYSANSPETTEALQFYADLINKYHVKPTDAERTGDPMKMFASGKVGMMNEGDWAVGDLLKLDMKDQWDIVPVPAGKAGSHATEYFAGYSANPGSKHLNEAVQLMEFITGPEGRKIAQSENKFTPEQQKIVQEAMDNGVPPRYQGFPKLKTIVNTMIQDVNDGKKNATQAAAEVKDSSQAAIDEVLSGK